MTDPVNTQKVVQQIAEQAAQQESPAQPKPEDAGDVERFEKAMGTTQDPQAAADPKIPTEVRPVDDPNAPESLGDAILKGVEKLRESHTQKVQKVKEIVAQTDYEPMSVGDTLKLQFELMQLNLQQEATTKVADKSSQGIQTLFKSQG